MAFTLPSPHGARNFARASVSRVRGVSGVGFFRLGIVLDVTVEPAPEDTNVPVLTDLAAECQLDGRPVGWFTAAPGHLPVLPRKGGTKQAHIELCCDLDRARVEAIEAVRAGGDLSLVVQLHWRFSDDQDESGNSETFEVNQGVWINVLSQMGYQKTLLIEIPMPDPNAQPGLAAAVRLLGEAQLDMIGGQDRDAIGKLRDVIEQVELDFGDDDRRDPAAVQLFAKSRSMDKAQRLRVVRQALKLVTHAASHQDQITVPISWGRTDSAQMIAMVAAFVNEMGAPDARPSRQPLPTAPGGSGSAGSGAPAPTTATSP